jgi:hypothetical protein
MEAELDLALDDEDDIPRCCWWCARSMVTEGVDEVMRDVGCCWCAEGIDRTDADVERTVTSRDAGRPLVPVRPEM